jgi:hypothetical protein
LNSASFALQQWRLLHLSDNGANAAPAPAALDHQQWQPEQAALSSILIRATALEVQFTITGLLAKV